jgi:hypothetical protein
MVCRDNRPPVAASIDSTRFAGIRSQEYGALLDMPILRVKLLMPPDSSAACLIMSLTNILNSLGVFGGSFSMNRC